MAHDESKPVQASKRRDSFQSISPAEAFSFLKETAGLVNWTARDFAKSLNIPLTTAEQVLPILQMQGYVKPDGSHWITTMQGELVSGSQKPRFRLDAVEQAIQHLAHLIKVVNQDRKSDYRVTEAIAFGDFLRKTSSRVQAADIGIGLQLRRNKDASAKNHKSEEAFLKHLRGRNPMLNLRPLEDWMTRRTHRDLLS
jgi:hypothetical protein